MFRAGVKRSGEAQNGLSEPLTRACKAGDSSQGVTPTPHAGEPARVSGVLMIYGSREAAMPRIAASTVTRASLRGRRARR